MVVVAHHLHHLHQEVALAACIMAVAEHAPANALEATHAKTVSNTVAATGVARNVLLHMMRRTSMHWKTLVVEEFMASITKAL